MKRITFNKPPVIGNEASYIYEAIDSRSLAGDKDFTHKCHEWFERELPCENVLLTTSCTHALEMAAMLIDVQLGDEVIMPSYTFVSTANAFVLRGAKIVFVDIRPDTMNIDETLIEAAITPKTKAIVPVHYAGVSCEMDTIMDIAQRHNLFVVEDAAQGMMAKYKGKSLGTIGHFGTYSFHETKNYTCGEGGLLIINDEAFVDQAEVVREKGTNRSQFFRGMVDKYSWVGVGSSYLPSELNAAYLWGQLEYAKNIQQNRVKAWGLYYKGFKELALSGHVSLPVCPSECEHNGHMFYLKVKDLNERSRLLSWLEEDGIGAVFHYVPLHSSVAGVEFACFHGIDQYTTLDSERLIRLPMFYGLKENEVDYIVESVKRFFLLN